MAEQRAVQLPPEIAIMVCNEVSKTIHFDERGRRHAVGHHVLLNLRLVNRFWSKPATELLFRRLTFPPTHNFDQVTESSGLASCVEELKFQWDGSSSEDFKSRHANFAKLTKIKKVEIDANISWDTRREWYGRGKIQLSREGWMADIQPFIPQFKSLERVLIRGTLSFINSMAQLKLPRPLRKLELRWRDDYHHSNTPLAPDTLWDTYNLIDLQELVVASEFWVPHWNWSHRNPLFSLAKGPSLTRLRRLTLLGLRIDDDSLLKLIRESFTSLQSINFTDVQMAPQSWATCLDLMVDCRNLRHLIITMADLSEIASFTESFRPPQNLVTLELSLVKCDGQLVMEILKENQATLRAVFIDWIYFIGRDTEKDWNPACEELLGSMNLDLVSFRRM